MSTLKQFHQYCTIEKEMSWTRMLKGGVVYVIESPGAGLRPNGGT